MDLNSMAGVYSLYGQRTTDSIGIRAWRCTSSHSGWNQRGKWQNSFNYSGYEQIIKSEKTHMYLTKFVPLLIPITIRTLELDQIHKNNFTNFPDDESLNFTLHSNISWLRYELWSPLLKEQALFPHPLPQFSCDNFPECLSNQLHSITSVSASFKYIS